MTNHIEPWLINHTRFLLRFSMCVLRASSKDLQEQAIDSWSTIDSAIITTALCASSQPSLTTPSKDSVRPSSTNAPRRAAVRTECCRSHYQKLSEESVHNRKKKRFADNLQCKRHRYVCSLEIVASPRYVNYLPQVFPRQCARSPFGLNNYEHKTERFTQLQGILTPQSHRNDFNETSEKNYIIWFFSVKECASFACMIYGRLILST